MPGLHNGNLCWGNRKSFYIYGEYPTETLLTMDCRRHEATTAQSSTMYLSSNGYYGYHKVTPQINDESMDTIEDSVKMETELRVPLANGIICRKRQNNEPNLDHYKRLRYQEATQSSETFPHNGRTGHISTYNLGFYALTFAEP